MATTPTIPKLQAHERDGAFPLIHDLYGDVDEVTFRHRLQQMETENGYEFHGAFASDLLVGVGGTSASRTSSMAAISGYTTSSLLVTTAATGSDRD